MQNIRNKGFTIIELIVVIAIIAVLAAIVTVNVNGYLAKIRDARRVMDMRTLITAIKMYQADNNGNYPPASGNANFYNWETSDNGSFITSLANGKYLPVGGIKDPLNIGGIGVSGHIYYYKISSDAASWCAESSNIAGVITFVPERNIQDYQACPSWPNNPMARCVCLPKY